MAVPENTPSDALVYRLNGLLQKARSVKPSSTIDPPLQVSELVKNDEALFVPVVDNKDAHTLAFEKAAKHIFYARLGTSAIESSDFVDIWNLLDILQYCGDRDVCSPQLVLLLIEELLDSQSISGCRIVFNFLESRREAIIANTSKNKDLVILRLCNELLRRLSRAEDPVFCGRVYIFLFQSFPLGDKSSVNLRGNFHVENVTTFEDYLKASSNKSDSMQVDPVEGSDDLKEKAGLDGDALKSSEADKSTLKEGTTTMDIDDLYPVFWSLQQSFSNPPRLFEEEQFKEFQKSLQATLAKFKEVPKVIQSGDSERKKGEKARGDDDQGEFASSFNPKYLTSRDLFKLELSDLAFQRHILVQALILIDFLLTLTEKSKTQGYYQNAQKAMQYSFTLREEDTEWALGIKNSIANYLQDGPDGKFYYRMVDTVLSRDKNWVRWKMENCQPFTRDRVSTKDFLEAKSGAQDELGRKRLAKPLGSSSALQFLSNTDAEKGLTQLQQSDRFSTPSAESYATKIRMTELDLDMVTSDEEKRQLEESKTSNSWRGLRLASKSRLSSFDRLEHGKGLERLFQPVTSIEAAGETDGRDSVPQEQHQSVEEQRAGEQSQVTTESVAE
ncbi:hypothetical protein BU24DRAFT_346476 [Aaosphaeria arxii CBS 175.79]|uniref:Nuclear matrix protein n=1 Tax=Aaosphaeria arxii CBS 175.79 TaxID=1450172 RepID=A0A6A5XSF2_9PLEO|nr:uncharacterized protein BU24DRAFT_346476 [Aaosphaeria arxii CBS 175.79]KAF2016265.1 hypothetical protein BU24DRAFT_346476 [Aaosphaeria arxii CBS 175.79]